MVLLFVNVQNVFEIKWNNVQFSFEFCKFINILMYIGEHYQFNKCNTWHIFKDIRVDRFTYRIYMAQCDVKHFVVLKGGESDLKEIRCVGS